MPVYSTAGFPPCDLWDFAIKLYSEKTVSDVCLSLQERQDIDVNILLFCIWVAASGRQNLTSEELETGITSSTEWQGHVVGPLRSLRWYLKSPEGNIDTRLAGDLRRVVADSEIYSERLELLMLGNIINRPATSSFGAQECANAAAENLLAYMAHVTNDLTPEDRADLLVVWQIAFPTAKPQYCALVEKQAEMELRS